MARKSIVVKERKKAKKVAGQFRRRLQLKREGAWEKLQKLSRYASPCCLTRRCQQCGRARGVYKKFGLCRICLREAVMRGDIPGCVKSSW